MRHGPNPAAAPSNLSLQCRHGNVRPAQIGEIEQDALGILQLKACRAVRVFDRLDPERGVHLRGNRIGFASVPFRNKMFAESPPLFGTGGTLNIVDISSVVVSMMVFPATPAAKKELGLLTMVWEMPTISAGLLRNGVVSVLSGNCTRVPVGGGKVDGGTWNLHGVMSTFLKAGGPATVFAEPCARIEVPCGMVAKRATVAACLGPRLRGFLQTAMSLW